MDATTPARRPTPTTYSIELLDLLQKVAQLPDSPLKIIEAGVIPAGLLIDWGNGESWHPLIVSQPAMDATVSSVTMALVLHARALMMHPMLWWESGADAWFAEMVKPNGEVVRGSDELPLRAVYIALEAVKRG